VSTYRTTAAVAARPSSAAASRQAPRDSVTGTASLGGSSRNAAAAWRLWQAKLAAAHAEPVAVYSWRSPEAQHAWPQQQLVACRSCSAVRHFTQARSATQAALYYSKLHCRAHSSARRTHDVQPCTRVQTTAAQVWPAVYRVFPTASSVTATARPQRRRSQLVVQTRGCTPSPAQPQPQPSPADRLLSAACSGAMQCSGASSAVWQVAIASAPVLQLQIAAVPTFPAPPGFLFNCRTESRTLCSCAISCTQSAATAVCWLCARGEAQCML
jgi:hypothetical protein